MADGQRLLVKVTRESLPQIRDKYPFLYLERGRLEVDDSSVKWLDADGQVIPLPIATINTLLLGPGTSITHAVRSAGWVKTAYCFTLQAFCPRPTPATSSSRSVWPQTTTRRWRWRGICTHAAFPMPSWQIKAWPP